MMDNCIFCKIAAKEIPGKVVYEDDTCIAFLDLSQTTNGHTLVIPKEHYDSFLEADPEVMAHCMKVAQKLANKIVENMHAKDVIFLLMRKKSLARQCIISIFILFQDMKKMIQSRLNLLIVQML